MGLGNLSKVDINLASSLASPKFCSKSILACLRIQLRSAPALKFLPLAFSTSTWHWSLVAKCSRVWIISVIITSSKALCLSARLRIICPTPLLSWHETYLKFSINCVVMVQHSQLSQYRFIGQDGQGHYIRNTPNLVSSIGALSAADKAKPTTSRVCAGSIMPSSHKRALA